MRDIKVIEAEISKLQAELADVKDYESMRNAAVHILKNLGWTHTRGKGWQKPRPEYKVFDSKTMDCLKVNDLVEHHDFDGVYIVRSLHGDCALVSKVTRVWATGCSASNTIQPMGRRYLKVLNRNSLIGKNL